MMFYGLCVVCVMCYGLRVVCMMCYGLCVQFNVYVLLECVNCV